MSIDYIFERIEPRRIGKPEPVEQYKLPELEIVYERVRRMLPQELPDKQTYEAERKLVEELL